MTTTTRKTLETDKVVGEPAVESTMEQQAEAIDEAHSIGDLPGMTGRGPTRNS